MSSLQPHTLGGGGGGAGSENETAEVRFGVWGANDKSNQ